MKNYTIGLDIGTNSVGWAVTQDNYELVRKNMKVLGNTERKKIKKNFWGVRLFDEGMTAEARRLNRTTRRRYIRRRQRLEYLQAIFCEEVKRIDPNFFMRLKESFYVPEDKSAERYPIFGTIEEEISYHKDYPTIYHSRKKLVDSNEKADIRIIYLALAHMIKYRGHFLIEGKLNAENTSVQETFSLFLKEYNEVFTKQADGTSVNLVDESIAVEAVLKAKGSKSRRAENVLTLFSNEKSNGTLFQFIKMIVGNQGNFKKTFSLEEDAKLQFSKEEYEEEVEALLAIVGDEYADVFVAAKNAYDALQLSEILTTTDQKTRAKLSSSMVDRYEEHKEDLAKLKKFVKNEIPEKFVEMFKADTVDGYAGYIEGKTTEEKFYKYLKKQLSGYEEASVFLNKIEQENFLRKQRTFDNGVIPHQIHLDELQKILKQQSEYYPFLKENGDKIEKILTFRIPYYVGPLAQKDKEGEFAWLTRKSDEKITPWNFDEVVDPVLSSIDFIERMTNKDTYLPEENVLPKNSFLYQKYTIFNELTKVSYLNEQGIEQNFSSQEKQEIFEDLFKVDRKVSKKKLINYLENQYQLNGVTIKRGFDEGQTNFNASFGVYHDFIKMGIEREFLNDAENQEVLEEIVKFLTIFEDRKMLKIQLEKYNDLFSGETMKKLIRRHYTGWGRLSQKLLDGIRDEKSGKTIMDYLIKDDGPKKNINRNLMQLINDPALSFKEKIAKAQLVEETDSLEESVSKLTGSPAIKKGILQSLKIVDEIVEIMGYAPKSIVVEMARENREGKRTESRLKAIEKALEELNSELLTVYPTSNEALRNNRLFLYYLQNGKDLYTGNDLDINQLFNYDVDHIIPQSFIKDDSLDNLALVSSKENRGKSDEALGIEIVNRQEKNWERLKACKLMSQRKFDHLTKIRRGGITDKDKEGFIKRQLVETRQITKNVAQILDNHFNFEKDDTGKIVRKVNVLTLKSALVSQFRKEFKLYKVREINDYHHAQDAYLNAIVGNTLLKVYPQLRPEFVYGEFQHMSAINRFKGTQKKLFNLNIMKFFKLDEVINQETGELLWSQKDLITVNKVMNSHQMNIVKKVERQKGRFTEETVVKKSNSDKLIARKRGLDPKKYGGLKSPTIVYSVIFSYEKGKKKQITFEIIGIPLMFQKEYEMNKIDYLEKRGYMNPTIKFELAKYSLFEGENGRRRLLSSAGELQKGNQLILPKKLVTLLYHSNKVQNNNKESLEYLNHHVSEYEELLKYITSFAENFTVAPKNLEKINELFRQHKEVSIKETATAFVNLMRFTQMGAPAEFNFFGTTISRRRYTTKKDFIDVFEGTLINQSITGLYESRWKVGGE
ncbi:type II CRISPR RNA-guided endonuclease Cas9 [Vagococcus sp.]|uniref:type II CRISPR RNA-guided endonuclease Cas9 n=1 Tax=Vagococcus sp. TaxID=1933889 RepID=UPI003F9CED48